MVVRVHRSLSRWLRTNEAFKQSKCCNFLGCFLFKNLEEHKLQFQHPIMLALKATKLHRIFKLMNIQNLSFVIKLIFKEHEKNNGQPVSNTTMSWESKSFFSKTGYHCSAILESMTKLRLSFKLLIMRCFFQTSDLSIHWPTHHDELFAQSLLFSTPLSFYPLSSCQTFLASNLAPTGFRDWG